MSKAKASPAAAIPSVDKVLNTPACIALIGEYGRDAVVDSARTVLSEVRRRLSNNQTADVTVSAIAARISAVLVALTAPTLKPVFNLTGTVLHTNLGRAPLPAAAVEAMTLAAGACNLEYDLETGHRGDRDSHVEEWICRLTGAEAATVVNNNAAAVLLLLNSLALGKDVVVSRGELVEIGGAFRVPDIMSRAGCRLIEIGTTNRTHLKDYQAAVDEQTALLMKVHTSNYEIQGFTAAVAESDVAKVAKQHGLPFVVDLGAGMLVDMERFGLPHEPTPAEAIADGADVVTFSGDKLLGGPQCGIIVGRADLIERIKKNPMKRAMRLDKVTIAALAAVLKLYANPEQLTAALPTLRLLSRSLESIAQTAERVLAEVRKRTGSGLAVELADCQSQIGSGSLPVDLLPSKALSIRLADAAKGGGAVNKIADAFRKLPVPVVGRIHDGAYLIDLRCLEDEGGFIAQLDQLTLQ